MNQQTYLPPSESPAEIVMVIAITILAALFIVTALAVIVTRLHNRNKN